MGRIKCSTPSVRPSVCLYVRDVSLIFWNEGCSWQLRASECPDVKNYKWRLNQVWHRMLYSCTHMSTVGVKGLNVLVGKFCCFCFTFVSVWVHWIMNWWSTFATFRLLCHHNPLHNPCALSIDVTYTPSCYTIILVDPYCSVGLTIPSIVITKDTATINSESEYEHLLPSKLAGVVYGFTVQGRSRREESEGEGHQFSARIWRGWVWRRRVNIGRRDTVW